MDVYILSSVLSENQNNDRYTVLSSVRFSPLWSVQCERGFRSCSRKLNSVLVLRIDKVWQDIPITNPGYANAITNMKSGAW